ncbi:MAG: GDP-mannose 4,6-dehydratase [Candidatus Aenigmarchaeota archaeon]|nr:GDP-mannose 4,6-dehydratase [Candidatus Aenigmarchaeota archaeon]
MRYLITGGAGFIGSHIVDKLLENNKNSQIHILDDLSSGKNINMGCIVHKTNICNNLAKIFEDNRIDIVIHTAAQVMVQKSIDFPVKDAEVNIFGSLNIIENCRKYGVKKIIYLNSGGAVVGNAEKLPTDEKALINPLSPYGVSKYIAEQYLKVYNNLYDLKYMSLRLSNVYGPRQKASSEGGVIALFINNIMQKTNPVIFGDGLQTRDFIFVKDVADAVMLATKTENHTVNISTGKETTIKRVLDLVRKSTNSKISEITRPQKPGEVRRSVLSNKAAQKILNWVPKTSLEDGIQKTVEYYKSLK